MTIAIKQNRIRYLKRMFERNRRKNLNVTTLFVAGQIFIYYEIVR